MNQHYYSTETVVPNISDIKDKHVTVMGLGLNGGGEAAVRFLLNHGAFVTVTDMKTKEQLLPTIESLNKEFSNTEKLQYVLGQHRIIDFENADFVIKNPGVKFTDNKFLAAAKSIETDISLFLRYSKSPLIAITGSKGKSSTVSAIHYGLNKAGITSFLGGNITVSPLTFLDKTNGHTPVVLELSSWQLSDLRGRKLLRPHIAIITKIVPDHQNWYGDMESYVADKKLIYSNQTQNDYLLCQADDKWGDQFASESKSKIIRYFPDGSFFSLSDTLPSTLLPSKNNIYPPLIKNLIVPGQHMKQNVGIASIAMSLVGVLPTNISSILSNYPGIPHRLEYFHDFRGFKFYNDSASTVPESSIAALNSFSCPVILLTGGTDKGLDFDSFANSILESQANKHLLSIYFLKGTGTDKLLHNLSKTNSKFLSANIYNTLNDMLIELKQDLQLFTTKKNTSSNQPVIVFSPGATSFGMFNNEFDRGSKFKLAVTKLFQ